MDNYATKKCSIGVGRKKPNSSTIGSILRVLVVATLTVGIRGRTVSTNYTEIEPSCAASSVDGQNGPMSTEWRAYESDSVESERDDRAESHEAQRPCRKICIGGAAVMSTLIVLLWCHCKGGGRKIKKQRDAKDSVKSSKIKSVSKIICLNERSVIREGGCIPSGYSAVLGKVRKSKHAKQITCLADRPTKLDLWKGGCIPSGYSAGPGEMTDGRLQSICKSNQKAKRQKIKVIGAAGEMETLTSNQRKIPLRHEL